MPFLCCIPSVFCLNLREEIYIVQNLLKTQEPEIAFKMIFS